MSESVKRKVIAALNREFGNNVKNLNKCHVLKEVYEERIQNIRKAVCFLAQYIIFEY